MKIKKEKKSLFIIITVSIFISFFVFIFLNKPFLLNNDQTYQYRYFYEEWIFLLKQFFQTKQLPMYSFYSFLGSDFFASQAYYVVGDPLVLFAFLFKNLEHFFIFETIVLVYLSAFCFHSFVEVYGIQKPNVRIWSSVIYSFSGFAAFFVGQFMFHRFYALMPLLFYSIERYLKYNKKSLISIAVSLLFIQNFYLMFPLSVLLPFYCIFRMMDCRYDWKNGIKKIMVMILYYFVGFSISSFVTLPAIQFILRNSRVGANNYQSLFFEAKVYFGLFFKTMHVFWEHWIFENAFISGFNGHLSFYSLYIGGLAFILSFSLLFKKRRMIILLFIPILLILFPKLNSVVHGFSDPSLRWSFILLFFILLGTVISLDDLDLKSFKKAFCCYLSILIVLFLLGLGTIPVFDIERNLAHICVIAIFLILLIIEYKLLLYRIQSYLIFSGVVVVFSFTLYIYGLNIQYYRHVDDLDKNTLQYLKDISGNQPYRIYINPKLLQPKSELNLNQSLHYRYQSFHSYQSTYEPVLEPFLRTNGINWHIISLDNTIIRHILAERYLITDSLTVTEEGEYHFVANINHLKIYEKNKYHNIGFTYNHFVPDGQIIQLEDINWERELIVDESVDTSLYQSELPSKELEVEYYSGNFIKGYINIDTPSILFISLPNNPGWKARINGENVDILTVHQSFMGVKLDHSGSYDIELSFVTPGLKQGLLISLTGGLFLIVTYLINRKLSIKFLSKNDYL